MLKLKVGDVLDVPKMKVYLIVDKIFHFDRETYYDCRYFYDTRDMLMRIYPPLVTLTSEDLEQYVLEKIDV